MWKTKNIVGQKFGRLLVIEKTDIRKRKNIVWKCQCDCGVLCDKITTDLVNDRIKSCGCLLEDFNKQLRLPPGEYGLNRLYKNYKASANTRKLEFAISKEAFANLTKLNCFYCGVEPRSISAPVSTKTSSLNAVENSKYIYNGLDRVDNSKGYVLDNVVTCCEYCNRAKLTMTQEAFIELANRIAKIHPIL